MDIALDSADNHGTDGADTSLGQQRPHYSHATFHSVGRHQHLGHEQDSVPKIDTDDAHTFDQRV